MKDRLYPWMIITAFLWAAALALQARFPVFPVWPGFVLFILLVMEWVFALVLKYKNRQE